MSFTDSNARIFYACQAILVAPGDTVPTDSSSKWLSGVQAVGVNTDTPSQTLFDPGNAQRNYHFYDQQEIEITIERVIDQGAEFFLQTTSVNLLNDANLGSGGGTGIKDYDISLIYTSDKFSRVGADRYNSSGDGDADQNKLLLTRYRNCLLSNISYNISVEGPVTETVTLITRRRDKVTDYTLQSFSDTQLPAADTSAGGLPSAESGNTIKWYDVTLSSPTVLPSEVSSMFDMSDTLNGLKITGLQSIDIGVSINYEELLDAGQRPGVHDQTKQNLWRFMNLPLGVSASFTGITRQNYPATITNSGAEFDDSRTITITAPKQNGATFTWDLGNFNYLADISTSGGDTEGGNVQTTISYQNDYNHAMFAKST